MLRRRRLHLAAITALTCGSLALGGCGADATDDSSSEGTPASTSSSTSQSSSSSTSAGASGSSSSAEETPDPYEIDCSRIPRPVMKSWLHGGKAPKAEPTDHGCRVVSSSQDGAVILEWRWLDVVGSGGDAGILRELETKGDPITVAPGISGTRLETDVAPTRKAMTAAKIKGRMLYVEATVTLDRSQTLKDLRRVSSGIATAYEDTTPPPRSTP